MRNACKAFLREILLLKSQTEFFDELKMPLGILICAFISSFPIQMSLTITGWSDASVLLASAPRKWLTLTESGKPHFPPSAN
jgi:hypothetical protein